ncbi:MAG: TIM barrel protein [Candidatus Brocadiaceae bacterium]|nr:TIM barrel protein [Candidatus Brocadiaceae bacterium]
METPMRIKQSFCYPCFKTPEMTLDQLCAEAAGIGLAGIELWWPGDDFDELVAAADRHGLAIASMCGHGTLAKGLNDPDEHERIEGEVRESLEIAARLRIPGLVCFSGNRNQGQSEEDALEATVAGLRRLAPHAERAGVNLNMELLNSRVDHAGYQCDHTAWGAAVCERVGSPSAKLLYDVYHMQVMEGDVIRTIRDNIRWIGHFHTAGNPGRRDLDDDQELNYAAICRAIAQTGYDGYVAHEFAPKADRIEGLRRAFAICDQEG